MNEAFVLRLAASVGLSTVNAVVRRFGRANALVVERYDRMRTDAGAQRLHQEDFCQALNVPAERKYEGEGGPGLARSVALVREHSSDPLADVHAVIRWQVFNAAVGNADGHAKNLALLLTRTGTRLAPIYDLVSTRAYPRVDRHLAMFIGGNADPDQLTAQDWSRFAADLGVGERYLKDTANQIVSAIGGALAPTLRAFEKAFGRKDLSALGGRTRHRENGPKGCGVAEDLSWCWCWCWRSANRGARIGSRESGRANRVVRIGSCESDRSIK
ncbi:MAG: HipA domain-containing protein [Deltaproteobacteria bacterium]|nr:HipA domain-containing protein [Deltaproteobacteria bacterium]